MSIVKSIHNRSGRTVGGAINHVTPSLDLQYYFGSAIVHPITAPLDTSTAKLNVETWLPDGNWVRWDGTGRWSGPVKVTESFGIVKIPVYLPEGSLIPLRTEKNAERPF